MNITTRSMSKKGNRKFVALDSEDEEEDPDFDLAEVAEATSEEPSRESSDAEGDFSDNEGDSMDDFIVEDSGDSDYDFEEEIALKYLDSKKKSIKIIDSPKNDDNVILTRNLQVPRVVSEEKKMRERNPRKRFTLPPLPFPRPSQDYLNTLDKEERKKLEELEKQINQMNKCDIPLKYKILQSELEISEKARIIKTIENSNENSGEYNKISHYVNTILSIPFNRYKNIDIKTKTVNNFILEASKVLENIIYGHENAKLEILQILTQMISNPKCGGQIIGIHGPAGIGKTTLIKEGLAKVLDRPFAFVSLGGCGDSSYLDGHSFTYEGSKSGCIVDILTKTNCMNPVIYFDELDKISESSKGDEIANLLIHLTDETQNMKFTDKYLGQNLFLDLSKAVFVFSFNDIEKVTPILRDRIHMISLKDFKVEEKVKIAQNYLIKTILKDFNIKSNKIIFTDSILEYIFNTYTNKNTDTGVRKLKQVLKTLISKLNMILVAKSNKSILKLLDIDQLKFPLEVNKNIVDKLLKHTDKVGMSAQVVASMYS
jgi:ATP-dependent Lon protease